jgi:hypothetical protein
MDGLRKFHRQQPFRPIRIRFADGQAFEVKHPEFMYVPPGSREQTFVVIDQDGLMTYVNILLVATIDPLRIGSNGGGKGGPRGRRG